jgi:5'-nucleotidase
MRILVTNDDGVHSTGLLEVARSLSEVGEVWVIAPEREQSAAGHGITLHKPLRMTEVRLDAPVQAAYATNGMPADCVILAVASDLPAPEMIVAGINAGANLGEEVLYSGTVSAAMEGSLQGITSFAVSVTSYVDCIVGPAAEFAARLAERLADKRLPADTFLNVNVPNVPADELGPAVVTRLGRRTYHNLLERRVDPRGKPYYWFSGDPQERDASEDTDIAAIAAGKISVTPVHFDLTSHQVTSELAALLDGIVE